MNISLLDLGAWAAICCGFTLLRTTTAPCRRELSRFGPGRKRTLTGLCLVALGGAVLAVVLARHFVHPH